MKMWQPISLSVFCCYSSQVTLRTVTSQPHVKFCFLLNEIYVTNILKMNRNPLKIEKIKKLSRIPWRKCG